MELECFIGEFQACHTSQCEILAGEVPLGQVFLRVPLLSNVSTIPPVLYAHLHRNAYDGQTGKALKASNKAMIFRKPRNIWQKYFHARFSVFKLTKSI
jgi:hypothetical protein